MRLTLSLHTQILRISHNTLVAVTIQEQLEAWDEQKNALNEHIKAGVELFGQFDLGSKQKPITFEDLEGSSPVFDRFRTRLGSFLSTHLPHSAKILPRDKVRLNLTRLNPADISCRSFLITFSNRTMNQRLIGASPQITCAQRPSFTVKHAMISCLSIQNHHSLANCCISSLSALTRPTIPLL